MSTGENEHVKWQTIKYIFKLKNMLLYKRSKKGFFGHFFNYYTMLPINYCKYERRYISLYATQWHC